MRDRIRALVVVAAAAVAGVACLAGGGCGMDAVGSAQWGPADASPMPPTQAQLPEQSSGVCSAPRTTCGSECADLQAAHEHCGSCAKACAPTEACVAGACQPLCAIGTSACAGACVDLAADTANCGACGKACKGGEVCSSGACTSSCGAGLTACSGKCVNTTSDRLHCGVCGHACGLNDVCSSGACKAVCAPIWRPTDVFGATMFGCAGRVSWPSRAVGCAAGLHVCSASEWTARNAGAAPSMSYWTDDELRYRGSSGSCAATTSTSSSAACPQDVPMRVCVGKFDLLGNTCNWTNCGLDTSAPNQHFGGCLGNPTAGVLCCAP